MKFRFLKTIWFILDEHRKIAPVLLLLTLVNSVLDFVGLAAIVPALLTLKNPEVIHQKAFLASIYDTFGFTSDNAFIFSLLLFIFSIFLLRSIVSIQIVKFNTVKIYAISTFLSKMVLGILFTKPITYIKNNNTSNLYRQINSYPTLFGSYVLFNLLSLITELIVVVLILTSILIINYKVFLIVIAFNVPVVYLFNLRYKKRIREYGEKANQETISMVKVFNNMIPGFTDIKMYGKEKFFGDMLIDHTKKVNRINAENTALGLIPGKVIELSAILVLVVIYGTSILLKIDNEAIFTTISVFILAAYRVMPSASKIMQSTLAIKNNSFIFPFLYKMVKSKRQREVEEKQVHFDKEIRFSNVWFHYNNSSNYTLKNINLSIKKGEMIGIIGESGAGKSSLINILLGFMDPTKGALSIDDSIVDETTVGSWRSRIGYVKQDTFLFDATLAENVALGQEINEASSARIEKCLRKVHLSSFLDSSKNGVHSDVGEMGGKVSGGQKQRIGIARAIYNDPEVIVFDEATSALDTETESEIINEIRELKERDKTIIIIAHRYSNLRYCDRIIRLREGEIEEEFDGYEKFVRQLEAKASK